jgi:hypothetical protein
MDLADHVTADGRVKLIKNRPRVEARFGSAKQGFNLEHVAVADHGRKRFNLEIDAQHGDAVCGSIEVKVTTCLFAAKF